MELTALVVFAAIISLGISGNPDAVVESIDIPYREKVAQGADGVYGAVAVSQTNPRKLLALGDYLPARLEDVRGHGNCLYFKMKCVNTDVPFIWKLIFKQGAGVDWFNVKEEQQFPATNYTRVERKVNANGERVKIEVNASRVAAILRFSGLKGDLQNNSLYIIDCRNFINQVEGKVFVGEDVTHSINHGDMWLAQFLSCPSPFYDPADWVKLGVKAIMECDEDISMAEFFCRNDVLLADDVSENEDSKKVELWAGIGFYIRSEWLGRWAMYSNEYKVKDDNGNEVLWSPLCPISLLKTSQEAIRVLVEMLPVFLKHELSQFGKFCTQKVYDAKKRMEYYTYHLLFYGQQGCFHLEKALKSSGDLGKYGHFRIWLHSVYGEGDHRVHLEKLLIQGWKEKLEPNKKKNAKDVLCLGKGVFRAGGKIGVGLLAFHIHADAVEFSKMRKFWGMSQSSSPKQYVLNGQVVRGEHPDLDKTIPEEARVGYKTYSGLAVHVPPTNEALYKSKFFNLGKFIHNTWEKDRWWVEEEPRTKKERRLKRRKLEDGIHARGWTLSLTQYISQSRKVFDYFQG